MKIEVRRFEFGTSWTIGNLFVNGQRVCFTLEREAKDSGKRKPAIPKGVYKLIRDMSNRFKCMMPHILDVPGYEGIRIHRGNTDKDTEGCILLGRTWVGGDFIGESNVAFIPFDFSLKEALADGEEVTLEVCDAVNP